ncbi:MAG: DUF2185 domain-containing protein [Pyrinomonadaceae bacterium]
MSDKKFAIPKESIQNLVPNSGGCLATDRIMVDGHEIGYMYREDSSRLYDSGWCFFAGDEDDNYANDPNRLGIYLVNTVANYDPDILPYIETPAPCAFEKIAGTKTYKRVVFQSG